MVPIGEASDGAGSIRIPASCCGVVGLKPSRGRVTLAPTGDLLVRRSLFPLRLAYGSRHRGLSRRRRRRIAWRSLHPRRSRRELADALARGAPQASGRLHRHSALRPADRSRGQGSGPVDGVRCLNGSATHVEEYDLAARPRHGMGRYTRMTCVQTAAIFEWLAPLVGREVTRGRRGAGHLGGNPAGPRRRAASSTSRDFEQVRQTRAQHRHRSRQLRRLHHADADAAAAARRLLRHVGAGPRPLQCEMDGFLLRLSLQHVGATGRLASARRCPVKAFPSACNSSAAMPTRRRCLPFRANSNPKCPGGIGARPSAPEGSRSRAALRRSGEAGPDAVRRPHVAAAARLLRIPAGRPSCCAGRRRRMAPPASSGVQAVAGVIQPRTMRTARWNRLPRSTMRA